MSASSVLLITVKRKAAFIQLGVFGCARVHNGGGGQFLESGRESEWRPVSRRFPSFTKHPMLGADWRPRSWTLEHLGYREVDRRC